MGGSRHGGEQRNAEGGRGHAGRRCGRAAAFYVVICVLLFLLLAAAGKEDLGPVSPGALRGMLVFLIPGGAGVFAALACFLPAAEESEFFRAFGWLYHLGLWLLAAAAGAVRAGTLSEKSAELWHMAYIAGWTLLAAGVIILILIIKEKHS